MLDLYDIITRMRLYALYNETINIFKKDLKS